MTVGDDALLAQLRADLAQPTPARRRDAANSFVDLVSSYDEAEAGTMARSLIEAAQHERDVSVQEAIANALAELAVNSLLSPALVEMAAAIPDLEDPGVLEQLEYLRDKAAGFPG